MTDIFRILKLYATLSIIRSSEVMDFQVLANLFLGSILFESRCFLVIEIEHDAFFMD